MSTPLYIGASGSKGPWSIAGMDTEEVENSEKLKEKIKQIKDDGTYQLIFVDESLAVDIHEDIEKLDEDPLPAIVLISRTGQSKNLAQQKINQLMVKAIGSDIFSN